MHRFREDELFFFRSSKTTPKSLTGSKQELLFLEIKLEGKNASNKR